LPLNPLFVHLHYIQINNSEKLICLDKKEVESILESAIQMMLKEPKILSIKRPIRTDGTLGPLTVCGDTHGQFLDLAK